jgi:uncharacterized protein
LRTVIGGQVKPYIQVPPAANETRHLPGPSEYFKRQCFVSADGEERLIAQVVRAIGDDNICFSTDNPHPDHPFDGVVAELADRTDIPEPSKKKILGENAARAFKV